jgi:hypothetical protein
LSLEKLVEDENSTLL